MTLNEDLQVPVIIIVKDFQKHLLSQVEVELFMSILGDKTS